MGQQAQRPFGAPLARQASAGSPAPGQPCSCSPQPHPSLTCCRLGCRVCVDGREGEWGSRGWGDLQEGAEEAPLAWAPGRPELGSAVDRAVLQPVGCLHLLAWVLHAAPAAGVGGPQEAWVGSLRPWPGLVGCDFPCQTRGTCPHRALTLTHQDRQMSRTEWP